MIGDLKKFQHEGILGGGKKLKKEGTGKSFGCGSGAIPDKSLEITSFRKT